jgi:outer membrane protein TolC
MTQSSTGDLTASTLQETQKQQKKQAKREAKLRLQVEEARGDVRRAEQKMANARINSEVAAARLRTLEEELKKMQGSSGNH